MPQIMLEGICKRFKVYERPEGRWGMLRGAFARRARVVQALDEVGFKIEPGELVGYIGPNGAGKSTSVKVMSGILTPDDGRCEILGRIPWKERVRHVGHIGVVFGQRSQLWWDVPVADSFDLLKEIYAIPSSAYRARLDELRETLDIGKLMKTPARQLSLGQRMRCELTAALLHSPDILFLDEPTIGLDAVSKLALREFLKRENREHGVTMLLTTHDMDDIEALCDRVMVIGHGKLLYDGKLQTLKERYTSCGRLMVSFDGSAPSSEALESIPGVIRVQDEAEGICIDYDDKYIPTHQIITQIAQAATVRDIQIQQQDIDQIIAAMYDDLAL